MAHVCLRSSTSRSVSRSALTTEVGFAFLLVFCPSSRRVDETSLGHDALGDGCATSTSND